MCLCLFDAISKLTVTVLFDAPTKDVKNLTLLFMVLFSFMVDHRWGRKRIVHFGMVNRDTVLFI